MKVNIIDPTTDNRWDDFIKNQAASTIFHTSAWARAIQEAYGFSPYYYVVENDRAEIKAAIPFHFIKSWLSLRRYLQDHDRR